MKATLSDSRLAEPHKSLALVLGLARAPTSDGRHFTLFEELQAAPPPPDPNADKEAAALLANLEKSPEERAALRDDAAVAALIQESLGDWGADMAGSGDVDDDDEAWNDNDAIEEAREKEQMEPQRETFDTQTDRRMMENDNGTALLPATGLLNSQQEDHLLEPPSNHSDPPHPEQLSPPLPPPELPPPVMWASAAEEDPLASARRKASQAFGARAEAASASRGSSSLLMAAPPMLSRWTQEGHGESSVVSDKAEGWVGGDLDSNFGGGSTIDLHVGDDNSHGGHHHHHSRPNLGWGSGDLHSNAAACRVVSEAEVVRAVLHALQGHASPLFEALTTQGDSQQGQGHGLPFRLAHLSASALKAYLTRFAKHAQDLHFLRCDLTNWVASFAPPPHETSATKNSLFDHNSISSSGPNDFSTSTVGGGGGGTLGALCNCVAEWVTAADQQLLELERISYQSLSHRGSEGAAAAKAWAYKTAAPSHASSGQAAFSTSSHFAPNAAGGTAAGASAGAFGAPPTASGAQTSKDRSFVCVSTLLQLEGALGPAARRAKDLRRLCHSLLPDMARSTPSAYNERVDNDDRSRVRRAVKVVDGVWAALHAAETMHLFKDVSAPEDTLKRNLPLPPPDAVTSTAWLRQAFTHCLSSLLTVFSAWCLEGRLLDPSRETFLSLATTENVPHTQAASNSGSGVAPGRSAQSAVRRPLESSASLQEPDIVPLCLKPLATALLTCGKAVEQMRAAAHKHDAYAAGASLRARRLPKQSSFQATSVLQPSFSFGASSSNEVDGWTEYGQWMGGALRFALLQQPRAQEASALCKDRFYCSVPSLTQLFVETASSNGENNPVAPVHHSIKLNTKATTHKHNTTTREAKSASSLGLHAGEFNPMMSEIPRHTNDWAMHEAAAGFGGCTPLPSVNTTVHPVFCPPKVQPTMDEDAPSFEEGTDGEEDDDDDTEEVGVAAPVPFHTDPLEATDVQHESSASWLHRVLIQPLSSHCAAAEAAAADTLRRGVAKRNDSTIRIQDDDSGRASDGGAGLESALAILRGIYLLGDAEILEGFEATLFQVSAADNIGSNSSFSGNLCTSVGSGNRKLEKVGAYGLLFPRSFDAAALTDLLRSSIADALSTRHMSAVQYSQRRRQTSSAAKLSTSASSVVLEEENNVTRPSKQQSATVSHQGTDSLPAPLPAAFAEGATGIQDFSSGGSASSSGILALNLDDFCVTLQKTTGSSLLSLPVPLHLNNEAGASTLSATPQASFVSNASFASSTSYAPPSSEGMKHLNRLVLECKVGWPLDAVVTPKAIEGYNKAFSLLLQVWKRGSESASNRILLHVFFSPAPVFLLALLIR